MHIIAVRWGSAQLEAVRPSTIGTGPLLGSDSGSSDGIVGRVIIETKGLLHTICKDINEKTGRILDHTIITFSSETAAKDAASYLDENMYTYDDKQGYSYGNYRRNPQKYIFKHEITEKDNWTGQDRSRYGTLKKITTTDGKSLPQTS